MNRLYEPLAAIEFRNIYKIQRDHPYNNVVFTKTIFTTHTRARAQEACPRDKFIAFIIIRLTTSRL